MSLINDPGKIGFNDFRISTVATESFIILILVSNSDFLNFELSFAKMAKRTQIVIQNKLFLCVYERLQWCVLNYGQFFENSS